MKNEDLPIIRLLNIDINQITEYQCVEYIINCLQQGRGGWVITPNLDHMYRMCHDENFRNLSKTADIIVADGMPLVWASKIQGTPLPERVAGSNLIHSLTKAAEDNNYTIFLLGGEGNAAEEASLVFKKQYPALQIVGQYAPPLGFEKNQQQTNYINQEILSCKPNIVYVALGSPKQEILIQKLKHILPEAWFIGVGISLSFISGHVKRAPKWVQKIGFEWLHRLIQEPTRLIKRYLVHGIPFAVYLFYVTLRQRFRSKNE